MRDHQRRIHIKDDHVLLVRLVRVDASVWPDGSINRWGIVARLGGEHQGNERGFRLGVMDGGAPGVMLADVFIAPAVIAVASKPTPS